MPDRSRRFWLSLCALAFAACGSPIRHGQTGVGGAGEEEEIDAALPPAPGDASAKDGAGKNSSDGAPGDGSAVDRSIASSDAPGPVDARVRPDVPPAIPI